MYTYFKQADTSICFCEFSSVIERALASSTYYYYFFFFSHFYISLIPVIKLWKHSNRVTYTYEKNFFFFFSLLTRISNAVVTHTVYIGITPSTYHCYTLFFRQYVDSCKWALRRVSYRRHFRMTMVSIQIKYII